MTKSLLIVDDEFGLADLLSEILTERGYTVRVAINGELGLAALALHPIDLVLLDVMMPIMDGPAMLAEMRANPRYAAIPVIMMTAVPRGVPEAPAPDAILRKPFTTEQLYALLDRLLAG